MSLFKMESNVIHPYFISNESTTSQYYVGKGSLVETYDNVSLRPSIVIKSGIKLTGGNGTKENAYQV